MALPYCRSHVSLIKIKRSIVGRFLGGNFPVRYIADGFFSVARFWPAYGLPRLGSLSVQCDSLNSPFVLSLFFLFFRFFDTRTEGGEFNTVSFECRSVRRESSFHHSSLRYDTSARRSAFTHSSHRDTVACSERAR